MLVGLAVTYFRAVEFLGLRGYPAGQAFMCTQDGISNDWAAIFDDVAMLNLALHVILASASLSWLCSFVVQAAWQVNIDLFGGQVSLEFRV